MILKNCPSTLREGFDTYSPKASKALFIRGKVNPILSFNLNEFHNENETADSLQRITVAGVQENFPAIIKKKEIRIATDGEIATHCLKPCPWSDLLQERKLIPANEHVTMQIASQVYKMQTAANGLCFTPKGQPVYITRRFDVLPNGEKLQVKDFAAILGKNYENCGTQFMYAGSYEEIALVLRENVAAWMVDMERFYELVVFNYIYGNGDASFKNFSLIFDGKDYRLAPAYGLVNTAIHTEARDFGLDGGLSGEIEKSFIFEATGHPCRYDFEIFGNKIGLVKTRIRKILNKYMRFPDMARHLLNQSFLSEKAKRAYAKTVRERISRFNRMSQ